MIPLYCINNCTYLNSFSEDKYHNGISNECHNISNTALKHTNATSYNYSNRADMWPQYAYITLNQRAFQHITT